MKKGWKAAITVFVTLAAFLVGSVALPPAFHKKVTKEITVADAAAGERVLCIDDNTDALIWRLRMIEQAQEELILSTFGFSDGSAGKDMMAALLAAADRGVQIRLLLDGYHGGKTLKNSDNFEALVTMPNVQIRLYNELNLLTPWKGNYRMHDKYLIVDQQMYMLGGRNTNDLFLGDYSSTPNIDRDILVYGTGAEGSLGQLRDYFEQVWALPECREYTYEDGDVEDTRAALRDRYQSLKTTYPEAFGFTDWEGSTVAANGVTLLTGEIGARNKAPVLWKSLCAYMAQGQQVLIQTPYVICGSEMYEDLTALCGSGIDVTILTNSPETGANPFGCTDYMNQQDEILDTGASILEFAGEHSLHAKTILIDDNLSIVGSFNMDMRSAYIDTETMLVIDCPELNATLREQTEAMAQESLCIAPDGTQTPGADYEKGTLSVGKNVVYCLLRLVGGLFRHLM